MGSFKYFADLNGQAVELKPNSIHEQGRKLFGEPVAYAPVYDREAGRWLHNYVEVTRTVRLKSNPSRHECDARCINASGRTMNCECSCGGKNHGRGAFMCTAEAA